MWLCHQPVCWRGWPCGSPAGWCHGNIWTLIVPASLFFFGAGMLFPLATTGAMEPFPYLAGAAGALVGGLQNMGSGLVAWMSAMLPQTGQFSLGLLMFAMSLLILLCWWPMSNRQQARTYCVIHFSGQKNGQSLCFLFFWRRIR